MQKRSDRIKLPANIYIEALLQSLENASSSLIQKTKTLGELFKNLIIHFVTHTIHTII